MSCEVELFRNRLNLNHESFPNCAEEIILLTELCHHIRTVTVYDWSVQGLKENCINKEAGKQRYGCTTANTQINLLLKVSVWNVLLDISSCSNF